MTVLRSLGLKVHGQFARVPRLAKAYITAWDVLLALLPEGWLKAHLRNNLVSADWPALSFAPVRVALAEGVEAVLVPRTPSVTFTKGMFRRRFGHEPEVFEFLAARLDRYDGVVEVGANVGVYTVFFCKRLAARGDRARVIAIEPARTAFADLQTHLALNGCANVEALNCAVSLRAGQAQFYENPWDWMKGSLDEPTARSFHRGGESVATVQTLAATDIERLAGGFARPLLKVDVVGAEAEALDALKAWILARRPEIVLGVWERNLASLNRSWIRERYELERIVPAGTQPRAEFRDRDYCNYFLRPR